ncbi:hypothetical protein BJ925_0326 [Rahnella aquatilis]|nr:hypothetical protein BJ925_0326 [Rahnella aquatilis]
MIIPIFRYMLFVIFCILMFILCMVPSMSDNSKLKEIARTNVDVIIAIMIIISGIFFLTA